jgi:integrase
VRAILVLAGILGWRGGETITAPRGCYDRKARTITRISSKSGRVVTSAVPAQVAKTLNVLFPHDATTLLVNSRGKPWTENGFRVSVFELLRQLEREKLIQRGLTIHGLRHTVATRARELGFTPRAIADTLGQETEGMALHYSKTADATRGVIEVVTKIAMNKKRTLSV